MEECVACGIPLRHSKNWLAHSSALARAVVFAHKPPDAVYLSKEDNRADDIARLNLHRLFPEAAVTVDLPGNTGQSSLFSEFSHLTKKRKTPAKQVFTGVPYFKKTEEGVRVFVTLRDKTQKVLTSKS